MEESKAKSDCLPYWWERPIEGHECFVCCGGDRVKKWCGSYGRVIVTGDNVTKLIEPIYDCNDRYRMLCVSAVREINAYNRLKHSMSAHFLRPCMTKIKVTQLHEVSIEFERAFCSLLEYMSCALLRQKLCQTHIALTGIELLKQLLEAIEELHFRGLVHRDIKPANILLFQDEGNSVLRVVIADMGGSRPPSKLDCMYRMTGEVCTKPYAPPEEKTGNHYPEFDVYSVARTVWHYMVSTRTNISKVITDLEEERVPYLLQKFPKFMSLLYKMSCPIDTRPSATEALQELLEPEVPHGKCAVNESGVCDMEIDDNIPVDMEFVRLEQFKKFWVSTFEEFPRTYFDQYSKELQKNGVKPIVMYFSLDGFTRLLSRMPSGLCWRHALHVFIRFSSVLFGKNDFSYYSLEHLIENRCHCRLWAPMEAQVLKGVDYEIITWAWPPSKVYSSYDALKQALIV